MSYPVANTADKAVDKTALMLKTKVKKVSIPILLLVLILSINAKTAFSQTNSSIQYVPLIGLTSVPDPLTLPNGAGNVRYKYAVKNFLSGTALSDIQVVDNNCSPVEFIEGDDNHDSKLDYGEVWRYSCVSKLSETTESIATATGTANNITAKHSAYTTVIVGSTTQPPLVSIVNITKVTHPLSLSPDGNNITYTYKVTNPGVVSLGGVSVTDDKCNKISGKLGDTNANNLLDIDEGWFYTCSARLTQTTTNTATVTAFANSLRATDNTTFTVTVDSPTIAPTSPLFDVAISPNADMDSNFRIIVWGILSGILMALVLYFVFIRKNLIIKKFIYIKSKVKNNHDEISS